MKTNFTDRLLDAIDEKGAPVCVGLDPAYEKLPQELKSQSDTIESKIETLREFCTGVLESVAPIVPAVKPQIAYFEVFRQAGLELYFDMVQKAQDLGLLVIGDIKRGDIGSTAQAYANAHMLQNPSPDAVTVNGYFGADGLEPFVNASREQGKGVFVLVRTSNPSAASVQDFSDANEKPFYEHMAQQLAQIGDAEGLIGQRGFSSIGAVVGATYPGEARRLRQCMKHQFFLVPGYGAQGASAADCAAAFDENGQGAIVNASRSVIYASSREQYAEKNWREAISTAARDFANDIASALEQ